MPEQQLTRRNGRPQACEACRKAKIRCNHETPICGRCERHGLQCVYHPAPMTGLKSTPASKRISRTSQPSKSTLASPPVPTWEQSPTVRQVPPPPRTTVTPKPVGLFKRPVTQFGTTKFSAVFSENQDSFQDAFSQETGNNASMASTAVPVTANEPISPKVTSPEKMRLGIEILRHFPTFRTSQVLETSLVNFDDIWTSEYMIHHCLKQIWQQYGDNLQESRTTEGLSNLASDLFTNSMKALPTENDFEAKDWFSGPDLRWEMIGILFTFFGQVYVSLQDWHPLLEFPEQQGRKRHQAATKMKECAEAILKICEAIDDNDMVVVLMKNTWRLESILIGDESDLIRKGSGIVMSSFVTVGLHRLPDSQQVTPLSEYRASLASSLYYLDKTESIFNARPPLLDRYYCTYRWPLDLSEDQLYGGAEVMAQAISQLDVNGWNTDGQVYASTLLRTRCSLTPFWEELLEITIGVNNIVSSEHIDGMIRKVEEVEASWPIQVRYCSIAKAAQSSTPRSPRDVYVLTRSHLEVLRCKFLLERLKISRFQGSAKMLLDYSQEMMTVVISCWLNRDQWSQYSSAFDWIVVCYGIPAAGVLCIELLRSIKPLPHATPSGTLFTSHLPRSQIIQSLTMFIGYLDWVRPTSGNHELCKRLQRVVKRIVDSVLDAQMMPLQLSGAGAGGVGGVVGGGGSGVQSTPPETPVFQNNGNFILDPMLMPLEDMDMSWLETMDWTEGDWLRDGNQPVSMIL